MKTNVWIDAMGVGMTDGHYYNLSRDKENRLWLSCWSDDGSMTDAELNALSLDDQVELGGFCDVSDSAFDTPDDKWIFAKEVAALLETDPITIIKSIRG